jgi:ribosomal protein S18 acetylase RimI-like enzyme
MIRVATQADEHAAMQTILLAFNNDPAVRWTWPDPVDFFENFPRFASAFAGKAFTHGSAWCVDDAAMGLLGVTLWLPPGVEPDEAAVDQSLRACLSPARQDEVFGVLEQMGAYHPAEPHWYLPLLGVDPFRQGQGHGAALMKHATRVFDQAGQVAYLESTNPKSVGLYERHGFELLGRIQEGSSPPIFPMVRAPR